MLLRFGPYVLDQASFELRRSNRRVLLAARPMELLLLLVKRRGELVTREAIARSLWPGMDFEDLDARINTAIAQIRYALIEEAAKPRYLETVIGKGLPVYWRSRDGPSCRGRCRGRCRGSSRGRICRRRICRLSGSSEWRGCWLDQNTWRSFRCSLV